jgi:hypothetical protein
MKSEDLRKVVSERTVRRWQHLYRTTGEVELKAPTGIYKKILPLKINNDFFQEMNLDNT